jgi:hypothetical protein
MFKEYLRYSKYATQKPVVTKRWLQRGARQKSRMVCRLELQTFLNQAQAVHRIGCVLDHLTIDTHFTHQTCGLQPLLHIDIGHCFEGNSIGIASAPTMYDSFFHSELEFMQRSHRVLKPLSRIVGRTRFSVVLSLIWQQYGLDCFCTRTCLFTRLKTESVCDNELVKQKYDNTESNIKIYCRR